MQWIEAHLQSVLHIDMIAAKSGYSKWHLQRLFKETTGIELGKYIRKRKLSRSAEELWLTETSILDIALKYHFTTQQAFTRSFKSNFNKTPGAYRKSSELDCSLLYPPYQKIKHPVHEPKIITLPDRLFRGIKHHYFCEFENIDRFDMSVRSNFFLKHFRNYQHLPSSLYGIIDLSSYKSLPNGVAISYMTVSDENCISTRKLTPIIIPGGNYLQFDYSGEAENVQQFILDVNQIHLPKFNVVRRKGVDIECFQFNEKKTSPQSSFLHFRYLIPYAYQGQVER